MLTGFVGCTRSVVGPTSPPIILQAIQHHGLCRRFPSERRRYPPLDNPLLELATPSQPSPPRTGCLDLHTTTELDHTQEEAQGTSKCTVEERLESAGCPVDEAIPHNLSGLHDDCDMCRNPSSRLPLVPAAVCQS